MHNAEKKVLIGRVGDSRDAIVRKQLDSGWMWWSQKHGVEESRCGVAAISEVIYVDEAESESPRVVCCGTTLNDGATEERGSDQQNN